MIRKIVGVALLMSLICCTLQSQTITTSGFEDFDLTNSSISFLAKRYNYYYFLKTSQTETEAMVFDTLMNRKAIVILDFLPQNRKAFTLMGNRDGFVSLFRTRDRNNVDVIQRVVLNDYLRITSRPKNIDTLISEDLVSVEWVNSPSEEYTMAIYKIGKKRKGSKQVIINLYDQEGEKIKSIEYSSYGDIDPDNMTLDNNGNILIAQTNEEEGDFSIWSSKLGEIDLNEVVISNGPMIINKVFLELNPDNQKTYFIVDFSKFEDDGRDEIRGFGYGYVDASNQISYQEVSNVSLDKLKYIFSKDSEFKLRYLNPTENGGMLVGLEEYHESQTSTYIGSAFGRGGGYTRMETQYELGDIHMLLVDKKGEIVWDHTFDKYQVSKGDLSPTMSYGVINKGSSITVYYNQSEVRGQRILKGWKIFPDGESREIFFKWKNAKQDYDFLVSRGSQISKFESVFPVFSQGKLGLAKLEIN